MKKLLKLLCNLFSKWRKPIVKGNPLSARKNQEYLERKKQGKDTDNF